jgi:murein L,D-transpeptidase YafK
VFRAGVLVAALGIAGCTETAIESGYVGGANTPVSSQLVKVMQSKGMDRGSPILARVFKEENTVEIWKQKSNGRFDLLVAYPICKMSGKLGPKYVEGDRQSPEGFYTVRPTHMNPNSQYHLAFNIGYPNAYDRAHGRTGSNLMVHGACSSSGCFSMNDAQMTEIYAVARDSFRGGQTEFQIQSYPFRMTAANMARYRKDPNYAFWKNLKEGYDYFEITKTPLKVDVCEKRYVFNAVTGPDAKFSAAGACPSYTHPETLKTAYQSYQSTYESTFAGALGSLRAPAPKPSIMGVQEARLVSDWSKKKARGERITVEPPSLTADGQVVQTTSRMGRVDSAVGRKMAALEAEAVAKKQAAEEKATAKAAAIAAAELAKKPPAPAQVIATQGPPVVTTAPVQEPGMLGRVGRRLTNLFGG